METIYTNSSTVPIDGAAAGLIAAIFGGFILFILVIALLIYVYMAICLMKIAKKTSTENAWFAWIPILNIVLMIQCAKKPLWWIILFFIPFANIVAMIIIWMAVAKNVGKPEWVGVLMIVPIANIIIPGYLAFSGNDAPVSDASPTV
jgi:ABC-type Na+ efflux pump permease subunit